MIENDSDLGKKKKYNFKIIVAGDGGVGKTTLLLRYVDGTFNLNTRMTIGIAFHQKVIVLDEESSCELLLWDFGGQRHFRAFLDSFIDGAHGAVLMFDLTRLTTLYNLTEWINILDKIAPNIPIILVGGKSDLLEGGIYPNEDKAIEFQQRYQWPRFLKTSAKTGQNINETFKLLAKDIKESITKE